MHHNSLHHNPLSKEIVPIRHCFCPSPLHLSPFPPHSRTSHFHLLTIPAVHMAHKQFIDHFFNLRMWHRKAFGHFCLSVMLQLLKSMTWKVHSFRIVKSNSYIIYVSLLQIQIQIQQLFLLRPLQSDRWRITEISQHVFHSRRQTEIKMF